MLKGGIEPNPGPKKIKPIHKVAREYPEKVSRITDDTQTVCAACAFAMARRMFVLNSSGDVSELTEKCSDHSEEGEKDR